MVENSHGGLLPKSPGNYRKGYHLADALSTPKREAMGCAKIRMTTVFIMPHRPSRLVSCTVPARAHSGLQTCVRSSNYPNVRQSWGDSSFWRNQKSGWAVFPFRRCKRAQEVDRVLSLSPGGSRQTLHQSAVIRTAARPRGRWRSHRIQDLTAGRLLL